MVTSFVTHNILKDPFTNHYEIEESLEIKTVTPVVQSNKLPEGFINISDEDIKNNTIPLSEITKIPKFANYNPGLPSKVMLLTHYKVKSKLC